MIAIPMAAGLLQPLGIVLRPEWGALVMSASTVIVAINALLLRQVHMGGELTAPTHDTRRLEMEASEQLKCVPCHGGNRQSQMRRLLNSFRKYLSGKSWNGMASNV